MIELVGTIVLAVFVALFAHDVSSNINTICFWLIRRAARFAPSKQRARLEEEWMADIEETSTVTLKVLTTLGFFLAAFNLRLTSSSRLVSNRRRYLDWLFKPLDWLLKDAFSDEHAMLDDYSQQMERGTTPIEDGELTGKRTANINFNRSLFVRVDELQISARAANLLRSDNIVYVGDLVQKTEAEMLRTPNCSRDSLFEIKKVLAEIGLHLGMEMPNWPPSNIEDLVKELNELR